MEVSAAVSGPARVGVGYGHNLIEKLGTARLLSAHRTKLLKNASIWVGYYVANGDQFLTARCAVLPDLIRVGRASGLRESWGIRFCLVLDFQI